MRTHPRFPRHQREPFPLTKPVRSPVGLREEDPRPTAAGGRLVVVSNRVADLSSTTQSGGLAVAMKEALAESGGVWFGWSGETRADAEEAEVETKRTGTITAATVPLTEAEVEKFYLGFANRCLWPLFHYRLDLTEIIPGHEQAYNAVNRRFAEKLWPLLEASDLVWVHDYHLIPFAAYLRRQGAKNRIGFFLHIPFPPPEIFSATPHHTQLARSLFAYDLLGFQTQRDRDNFVRYAVEYLGGRRLPGGGLSCFGRRIRTEAIPIGIDAEEFASTARANVCNEELDRMLAQIDPAGLVVSVDRLDYSKGLPERLKGLRHFLESEPHWRGRASLVQVAPPTREGVDAYDEIRDEVERMVGAINGKFGDPGWTPVHYVHRAVPRERLAGLFRRARLGLVTPLRDGMNLVAKEYVAAQDPDDPGVLVLSQFAGAAEELEEAALIVNPLDAAAVADAIRAGLEMPRPERRERHALLYNRINSRDIHWWRERFLVALRSLEMPRGVPPERGSLRGGAQTGSRQESAAPAFPPPSDLVTERLHGLSTENPQSVGSKANVFPRS